MKAIANKRIALALLLGLCVVSTISLRAEDECDAVEVAGLAEKFDKASQELAQATNELAQAQEALDELGALLIEAEEEDVAQVKAA